MEPLAAQSEFEQRKLYRLQLADKIIVERARGQKVTFMKGLEQHSGQQDMLFTPWKYYVAPWGRRGGKSIGAAFWLTEGLSIQGFRQWILAPDYELTDKVFHYVYKWVVEDKVLGENAVKKAHFTDQKRYIEMKWGAFLQGKSMLSSSIIGEELDRVVLDEAALLKERIWTESIEPCLMDRDGEAMFTSKPCGRNWFCEYFDRRLDPQMKEDGWAGSVFWSADNPFHDPEWLDKKRRTTPEIEFRREYEASFEDYAGLIYPQYRDRLWTPDGKGGHLYDPKKMEFDVPFTNYRGIDVGWRHPTACLWGKTVRSPEDDLYIYREYKGKPNTAHAEHAKNISLLTMGEKIYNSWISPDAKRGHGLYPKPKATSEERTCAHDVYRDHGIYARSAVDDVGAGISIFREYLNATLEKNPHHPRIFISQECEQLRSELLQYVHKEVDHRSDWEQPEAPRKYKDDLVDGARYLTAGKPRYVNVTWDEDQRDEEPFDDEQELLHATRDRSIRMMR